MESVGFKEWALVCAALGRGEQSILLRKGGIAEGREGFGFRHQEFFLFPTFFHEQAGLVRTAGAEAPGPGEGQIEIQLFAKLISAAHVTSWEIAAALEPLHILQESVVRERFAYDEVPGLHVAFVRVYRLSPPWEFPDAPRYGGCRSWVPLPELPDLTQMEPVLSDREFDEALESFQGICQPEPVIPSPEISPRPRPRRRSRRDLPRRSG